MVSVVRAALAAPIVLFACGAFPQSQRAPMKLGTVPTLNGTAYCVYYRDAKSGDVYRVSLDGAKRELVVACGQGRAIHFADTRPTATDQGRIHLANVPTGGWTVLEVASRRKTFAIDGSSAKKQPLHTAYTDRESKWSLTFVQTQSTFEPGHHHTFIDKVVLADGKRTRTYDVANVEATRSPVAGLVDEKHAVVIDGQNVVVWNLETDKRTCVAYGSTAVLWPRSLDSKDRYVPLASSTTHQWRM